MNTPLIVQLAAASAPSIIAIARARFRVLMGQLRWLMR